MEDPDGATVFRRLDMPNVGPVTVTGLPFDQTTLPLPEPLPAVDLGQNTREVMGEWLGMSDEAIDAVIDEVAFA